MLPAAIRVLPANICVKLALNYDKHDFKNISTAFVCGRPM